ncbi:pericentrin [Silurus asotus]|uniref:Pericentrin n=1 Tax=Silurus asotus TaxID=30991 RepID=A0AAD5ACV5_SILAS|nr:pericentrin [Silurus asotus]
MDQDERQRKLEAGRAKFAHFRQQRAKNNSANPKKTVKKKSQPPETNEDSAAHVESRPEDVHGFDDKSELEESAQIHDSGDLEENRTMLEEQSLVPEDRLAADQPDQEEELLGELVDSHTSREQLKQLQTAVEKRNEIISQLSVNLQAALTSRDQVQLEAQQLTGQIQELQEQLQQAKEYLRSKSVGWLDLSQTHRQLRVEQTLQMSNDQQAVLAQKETEITALQQKLAVMEDSLSQIQSAFTSNNTEHSKSSSCHNGRISPQIDNFDSNSDLIERLKHELDEERQNSKRAQERAEELQETVLKFELEKFEMEALLKTVRDDLERVEKEAREEQQFKEEKERLNQDVVRLDGLVQELQCRLREEEETSKHERSKYEAEIANCELRLQTLEEERMLNVAQLSEAHEAAIRRLREEHSEEVKQIQELLEQIRNHDLHSAPSELDASGNWIQISEEQNTQETTTEVSPEAVLSMNASGIDDMMERYLRSAVQHESSLVEQSLQECSINSSVSKLEYEDESRFLVHFESGSCNTNPDNQPSGTDGMSFTQAQWQSFNSPSNSQNASMDLGKELLIQECRDLTEQLEEKQRQLDVLQEEVRCSAKELDEARERWCKASEELEETKCELEIERDKRLHFEEILNEKIHEIDNLKNNHSYLESQKENKHLTPDVEFKENNFSTEELLENLKEEKDKLILQLKQKEQLVRDIQEQKMAGDSVSCEVHAVFGHQLSSLQAQSEQVIAQLENQREKNETMSVLLGQKTLEVDSKYREIQELRAEVEERMENVQRLEKVRADLEFKLTCLKENLNNMEEAVRQGSAEKAALETRMLELEKQNRSMEKVLESELESFELQLQTKDVELEQMKEAREKAEEELMEKEDALQKVLREHEEEKTRLKEKHQQELLDWSLRLEKELSVLRSNLEEEQKKQIMLIKQVHEREHQREMDDQASERREEVDRLKAELSEELRESMEAAHQAELSQVQTQHTLELEALRLSLTNLHTAQLELTQSNLQKEKEAALSELQANLREKWAQESAMLHTRQQFELEKLREQSREQIREQERQAELQLQLAIDDLNHGWEKRLSDEWTALEGQQAGRIEDAKAQWMQDFNKKQSELQEALNSAEERLAKTQHKLSELQRSKEDEIKHLESELSQAWSDRDSAARAVEELVASHKVVLQEQQTLMHELEEKEKLLKQEVDRLLTEKEALKTSSEQEITNLWSQLESMRTSRQELGDLKEQLLARTSRVDDLERLKQEFSQQRRELQEQNEIELENLRVYFEQRLQASEENHREEISLLQLRLVEGALEDSALKAGDVSFLSDGKAEEEERGDSLAEITEQLEKHKMELDSLRLQLEEKHKQDLEQLRCSMALSYREELLQARSELTDRYYDDMDQLKTKHALEIEQLRAKLSDSHLKEITKLRLQSVRDVARQVEAEVDEKTRVQTQEHQTRLTQLASDTERILGLEKELAELTLQHGRELERATEELRELEHRLKKNFEEELRTRLEQAQEDEKARVTEEQLQLQDQLRAQAEERMASIREEIQVANEEKMELEQKLAQAEELLTVERQRMHELHASLESEESPQVVALKQRLEAQYASELRTAKSTMAAEVKELNALLREQTESRIQEATCRHQEEQRQLAEKLSKQREEDLQKQKQHHAQELQSQTVLLEQHISKLKQLQKEYEELKTQHQNELDLLCSTHEATLDSLAEKHRAELDKLQVVLQETNLAQLEAQEVELGARHKQEMEELETRMLCNMDTLESTYLQEIQTVREEKDAVIQELRASLEQGQAKEIERVKLEELMIREDLQKELARVHMEKFSAMATELGHAHQAELSEALASQMAALKSDHNSALETLRHHVLDLETQHSIALQEVTNMTTKENQQLQQQLDALNAQHQQQLQELRASSSREIEALRRELEEEASRQRLHFLEEAELLKCQSEEQLQQKIAQLKEDSEREKTTALDELERTLREQNQQTELSYNDKMNQLTAQLQQLDTVVSQLRAEASGLQGELEGKRSEMATLETLLQRRERESQEGANLLAMLRDDLNTATQQRQELQLAHDRLQQLILEMLRITIATEEEIGRKLGICVEGDPAEGKTTNMTPSDKCDRQETGLDGHGVGAAEGGPNCSLFSSVIDEGLELSQRLCESLFSGPDGDLDPEREEFVLGACTRLRAAVDKLLDLVFDSTVQLEQLRALQAALDEQFSEGGEAKNALLLQHTQLLEQLDQEASVKSQLQLELHKTEGLMEGYVAEKAALEEALQQKEVREQRLVEELESIRAQLQELSEEHSLLQRQLDALSAGLGEPEKALLAEAERLGQERVDVQRQAEKDRVGLGSRLRSLELALEEHESRAQQQEELHRSQTEDLQQHINALEKQLKHHRQFIDEQAVEREHERDEFQQEIKNLEVQLRAPSKGHTGGDTKGQRVESLQALIKDKNEDYGVLLSVKEQCQRDLEDRNEEIDKMASRIRELEQALLNSAEAGRVVSQLEQELQKARKTMQELSQDKEALQQQLYSNKLQISALQSKLDETRHRFPDPIADPNLGEQLEMLQRELHSKEEQVEVLLERVEALEKSLAVKEEDIRQLSLQLDLKTNESQAKEEELHLRITELQRISGSAGDRKQAAQTAAGRRRYLSTTASCCSFGGEVLERVEALEKSLAVKEEDIRQLSLQLDLKINESQAKEEELHLRITELQETVSRLHRQQQEEGDISALQLPAALLEEKNLEIDHLNQQVLHLQQELDTTKENKTLEKKQADIEDLRAQVERLRGDQERLRQAKEEEAEQLHEVINKLQEELSQLDPNRHEVSDPNTDSPEPPEFPWSPRPQHGTEESLCHELSSQTLQSCRTKLHELQMDLERSAEEKEALQRLLLTQEEQYGQQVQALGHSLGEERGRVVLLEQEAGELKIHLDQKEAEVENLKDRLQKLEDQLINLKDMDLQLKKAEESRKVAQQEMTRLTEEVQKHAEEREKFEDGENTVVQMSLRVAELEEELQRRDSDIAILETGKKELFIEKQALQKREGKLQEEIEKLKQEVSAKSFQIQELNMQLEEKVTKQEESQKEVLTCAEETLAKAEAALREKEEHLVHLRLQHDSLRAELAAVKEGLSTSTERAEKLQEEGQTKDRALADLEENNQHLRAELRSLQEDLEVQEEELAYQQRELEELRQRCRHQERVELHNTKTEHRFLDGLSHDSSLSSPEVLRRLDCSEERPSHLHASHLSELSGLRNTSLELTSKHSPMERNELKRPLALLPEADPPSRSSHSASPNSLAISENLSVLDSLDADKVQELENLDDVTPSHSPSRSPLSSTSPVSAPEWASDGYGSNVSSELEAKLKQELEHTERLDTHFLEYLRSRDMAPASRSDSAAGSVHHTYELLSPELQAMLNQVYRESCRVLSLSHRPPPAGQPHPDSEEAPPPSWQRERRALQETVLSLRELLCRMAEREPKMDGEVDWRRELLQAVRSVFDGERKWFHTQLQDVMATNTATDYTDLLRHMEALLQKQEEQQRRSLEQLLSADRNSLLAEIRSLHEQLHACTLQSQEQLRELQSSLSAVREEGTHTQQHLHRQVGELERRLQQEQTAYQELRRSLEEEQSRWTDQHRQVEVEQKVVMQLKVELEERTQQLHLSSKSLEELQAQIHKLRLKLESEEEEHQACVEAVEQEQARVKQLQEELEHERLSSKRTQEENTHNQESLRATLSEHATRLSELNSALEQERVAVSNLRAELQIEQSRCEALLAQERERTEMALSRLDEERSRSAELSRTLSNQAQEHDRRLEEEVRSQEAAGAHDRMFIQELRAQLEQERRQAEELAATVDRLQAQVLQGKRRQEEVAQQEAQRGQEEVKRLRSALEGLQAQRAEVSRTLETERHRASQLQTELDVLKETMREVKEKERAREEQREKQRWHEKQEQEDKERRQERTKGKLLELEALRERDQQRLRQLQQTLADLEQQEKRLTSERLHRDLHTTDSTRIAHTQDSSSSSSLLERVLKENSDLAERLAALSEEKISLKHTVSCLERDLHNLKRNEQVQGRPVCFIRETGLAKGEGGIAGSSTQSRAREEQREKQRWHEKQEQEDKERRQERTKGKLDSSSSSSLLERVLKENSDLAERLAALSEEKISLKHTVSCLERDLHNLKRNEQVDQSALSEKPAWQKEKAALQAALRKAEDDLVKATSRNENRPSEFSNNKVQRLYEKYLRAESYRKSLVYQKRYLLLLLGGFQDCEQATLALIARMGAQPSLVTQASRPLSRFRSAVRALIAISRLKFLTRKWQRATKKSSVGGVTINSAAVRTEVLKPQQSGAAFNSPPTRDRILLQRTAASPLVPHTKSPFRLHNGGYSSSILVPSERTLTPSQEQERSLADYIHHLESVQQRLGAVRPVPRDERRRSLPDMMGFRQKWLHENRIWLYLSCLSPSYTWPLGSPATFPIPRKTDR